MESRTKTTVVGILVLILLIAGSYWIVSGRAANNISKEEAMRLAEDEINRREGDLSAEAISAKLEDDSEEGSSEKYYDVIVKSTSGYWEVEVYTEDGRIGEVEGPTSNPDP
jgi:hypothetical protein